MRKIVFFPFFFLLIFSSCAKEAKERVRFDVFGSEDVIFAKTIQEKDGSFLKIFEFSESAISIFPKGSLFVELFSSSFEESDFFEIGFLLKSENEKNPVFSTKIQGNAKNFFVNRASARVRLEIFSKKDEIVRGFFVKSAQSISVRATGMCEKKIGVDVSTSIPIFAFSADGGKEASAKIISFAGKNPFFLKENALFPLLNVKFRAGAKKNARVVISVSGEKFTLRRPVEDEDSILIPLSCVNRDSISPIIVEEGGDSLDSILLTPAAESSLVFKENTRFVLSPVKLDPGLVLYYPKKNWRGADYELFEWDRFPGVLLMDISNYSVQNDFFRRLAFFVEKAGFRGKLLSDEFLFDKHAYNAHDYRAESLAAFFEKARKEHFPLGEKERLLKEILVKNGVIKIDENGHVLPGIGAVISISQESPMYLRNQFISHEGWHGIFFVDKDFRDFVYSEFDSMDSRTRDYLVRYFQVTPSLNYDIKDAYLLRNEFMAYMLQKPVSDIARYFSDMASRRHSQDLAKKEADYIIETNAQGFVDAAKRLSDYAEKRWNLSAGRVWLIN